MSTAFGQSTVLGYPRIGANRELKKAVEAYWAGTVDAEALASTAAGLRAQVWRTLRDARLDAIPSNTFSYYDQMLDTAVAVGAVPTRFSRLGLSALDTYFAMARGVDAEPALELTKWFDTNYHYLVPEIAPDTVFTANPAKALDEYAEARGLGITTRPVFVGPATFLLLAKGVDPFARLDDLVQAYARILAELAHAGVGWVQLDEPAYAADRSPAEIDALGRAYTRLGELTHRPRIFVATYFGDLGDALPALLDTPVDAVGLDLVAGAGNLHRLAAAGPLGGKTIVAGLVDGRNVWRTDLRAAVAAGATVAGLADHVAVSSSCSLLHVPVDLSAETHLDPRLSERLAFARQKVDEIVLLGRRCATAPRRCPRPCRPPRPTGVTTTYAAASPRCAATGSAATHPTRPPGSSNGWACRSCRPPRSGRFRRPPSCAGPAPHTGPAASTTPATRRGSARRWRRSSGCRNDWAWTCSCTGNRSATTWCSTSASNSTASPPRVTAGCSPTAPAAYARRSSTATCRAGPR